MVTEVMDRQALVKGVRRVVVKLGSAVLTTSHGGLDTEHIQCLCDSFARVQTGGYELVLVSSGAVAAGSRKMGLRRKPKSIPEKQAAAAVGQARLMWVYERSFEKGDVQVAQILLTRDDLSDRRRFLNARNTLWTLIRWGILPIINENDSVITEEIQFGDNDCLSALVTNLIQADLLVILTDIDGFYDADPKVNPQARRISVIPDVDDRVLSSVQLTTSAVGTGGMASKLQAAKTAAVYGVPTIIASGRSGTVLEEILSGEALGTLVLPKEARITSWKHWIAYSKTPCGHLVVDAGAKRVILEHGRSLLPSGIRAVHGDFGAGDSVSCVDEEGAEFARGLTNYGSDEVRRIRGRKSSEIESLLGYRYYDEVIHRDDLVVLR
jgi:glutamate 5-kinase